MDEIKFEEPNWLSASLETIGCYETVSKKLYDQIPKSFQDDLVTLGNYSLVSGINDNIIELNKIPDSLINDIQYAEVYNSVPVNSVIDSIKDLSVESAIPSSLAFNNFTFDEPNYRMTINSPSSIPNFLSETELYDNPILNLNSSGQNFINNLSTNALSTNYISFSKTDKQFESINDLHSIHKFGFSPKGSLDLITDYDNIHDGIQFGAKSNFQIGTPDYGFISGSILSEKNAPNYFENILETRLDVYKSEIVNYIDASIHNKLSFISNHQIFFSTNNFSLSEINEIVDSKFKDFREEFMEDVRRVIGKELQKFKIELDKEGLFADSFDIIPGIGPIIKLGYKATQLMSETKTILM